LSFGCHRSLSRLPPRLRGSRRGLGL